MPSSPQSPTSTSLARLITAFASTWDDVAAAIGVAGDDSLPSDEQIHVAHDQRLKTLEIAVLHSIAHQLSAIRQHELNPSFARL